jgi:hypothetical protein
MDKSLEIFVSKLFKTKMIEMNMTFTMSESLMEFSDSTQAFQDKES